MAGLSPLWPTIRTVIADAGHESRKLAAEVKRHEDWRLVIVKRSEPAFRIVGLNWIVERTFGGSAGIVASPRTTSSRCRLRRRSSRSLASEQC